MQLLQVYSLELQISSTTTVKYLLLTIFITHSLQLTDGVQKSNKGSIHSISLYLKLDVNVTCLENSTTPKLITGSDPRTIHVTKLLINFLPRNQRNIRTPTSGLVGRRHANGDICTSFLIVFLWQFSCLLQQKLNIIITNILVLLFHGK